MSVHSSNEWMANPFIINAAATWVTFAQRSSIVGAVSHFNALQTFVRSAFEHNTKLYAVQHYAYIENMCKCHVNYTRYVKMDEWRAIYYSHQAAWELACDSLPRFSPRHQRNGIRIACNIQRWQLRNWHLLRPFMVLQYSLLYHLYRKPCYV